MAKEKFPKVIIGPAILAYSYITKPDSGGKYSDDKYKGTAVVDKDSPIVKKLKAACVAAAKQKWGPKVKMTKIHLPLKDGDAKDKEEFEGKFLIEAKSKWPPSCVDVNRAELPEGVVPMAGDLVKISAECYPYGEEKGVSLQLRAVKLLKKNNAGYDASNDFADDEDDEEYEGFSDTSSDDDDDAYGDDVDDF